MRGNLASRRASGLIIALCVLAMLAIMATTFITLMRLDVRVTRNYVDDQRCEMLAYGMLNYFKSILRDDSDRTWGRYANRTTAVGFITYDCSQNTSVVQKRIPGFYEYTAGNPVADERRGTPVSRSFWFSAPYKSWNDAPGNLYVSGEGIFQQSFAWHDYYGYTTGRVGRYLDAGSNREYDLWLGANLNSLDSQGRAVCATSNYPGATPIDDDGDGNANPAWVGAWSGGAASSNENSALENYYYDTAPFVIFSGNTYFQSGSRMTGESMLPGGLFWRWGVKVGPTQEEYANLNVIGNLDGAGAEVSASNPYNSVYLNNMGGLGLVARRAYDERASTVPSQHLGRIEWRGFPNEYEYNKVHSESGQNQTFPGFPAGFNNVAYAPAAANLEKLFARHRYPGSPALGSYDDGQIPDVGAHRATARALICYRWGNGSGLPCDGTDHWRVGWRRDGATYYKFPSPENPMGSDRYFGTNDAIEHDRPVNSIDTSPVASIMAQYGGDQEWFKMRPHVTMWSTDTILRGKIWPTEGGPNSGGYTPTVGDWHSMDILKRVNINMIGAKGPENLPGEDAVLKTNWANKAQHERDRLYYMLVNALNYTGTPNYQHLACQFIASLADMVDRDTNETYYQAPDGSGWALGVEKHPVINEVVFYSTRGAKTASYQLTGLRFELYNPMENIPWIRDADEAYDVSNYYLRIQSASPLYQPHNYRLGDLVRYGSDPAHPDTKYTYPSSPPPYPYSDWVSGISDGTVKMIGADGMYGYPQASTVTWDQTWTRYMHLGWPIVSGTCMPSGLTQLELEGRALTTDPNFLGVKLSLWKPLSGNASDGNPAGNVPTSPGKVEMINGVKCICVDYTDNLKLVHPYTPNTTYTTWNGPGGANQDAYLGIYRRWDPMNAKIYGTQGTDETSNVLWCPGWGLTNYPTLGRPNTGYPGSASTVPPPGSGTSTSQYYRCRERNFKVVDGDLPSIGWLGELMMRNDAQDGPLTWVHDNPQQPSKLDGNGNLYSQNQLDWKAKFDLCCPFYQAVPPAGHLTPGAAQMNSINLHVLDMFTVWDPSNDGIDNDGDGAIDDADTGLQAGDKCGPEVRVFGKIDLNMVTKEVMATVFPDDDALQGHLALDSSMGYLCSLERSSHRKATAPYGYGPFETIGDFMRTDTISPYPGAMICSTATAGGGWVADFPSEGITKFYWNYSTGGATGDDDGNGIYDDRSERDMIFNWISNYLTTRSNVFEVDINVDIGAPPYYPNNNGTPLKLPFPAYKTRQSFGHKQVTAILDRSTCLRVNSNGRCDFTGPIEPRLIRWTDDLIVY